MIKNFFSDMDNKISNIFKIQKEFHDEACILMITYLDELSNYTHLCSKENNKEKFIRFISEYSSMKNYINFVLMHRIYYIKDNAEKENYRLACTKIYEENRDKFEEFLVKMKRDNEIMLTESLSIIDIERIKDLHTYFEDTKQYHYFLRKIKFGELFYECRNFCVHEHRNQFHSDINNEPYYIYINCINGDGYISFEIPFEFICNILDECYKKVRSEFNYNINNTWNWDQ